MTTEGEAGKVDAGLEAFAASIAAEAATAPGGQGAAASPAAVAPGSATPAAPAAIDWRQEARDLWRVIAMLKLRWPSLGGVFSDQTIERLAEVWAPILERHNIDLGKLMIYFSAGIATAPVIGEAWVAIRHDRAAASSGRELAVPNQAPAAAKAPAPPASSSAAPPAPSSS